MNINIPSSIGGLNLRDSLDSMDIRDCIQMDNIIPSPMCDRVRTGFVNFSEQPANCLISHPVLGEEALIYGYNTQLGSIDMTGVATIYQDIFNSDDWSGTQFADGIGKIHTIIANGVNIPQDYSSGIFADIGFVIPDGVLLDAPNGYKNRLYFVKKNSFSLYYGGVQSIAGDLTEFNAAPFFKLGGYILATAGWTQDGGDGMDDMLCIFSSNGEVLIYSGSSPDNEDWALNGRFVIPSPINKKSFQNMGADIIVATKQGYVPLAQVLASNRANIAQISGKLANITQGKDFSRRWSINWFPLEGWMFVNSPSSAGKYAYEQHVLNTQTNSWCRFVGMDAETWAIVGDRIFFGNKSGVFEANVGNSDNGNYITYYKQMAYQDFGIAEKKQIVRVVPRYNTDGADIIYKKINVDFKQGKITPLNFLDRSIYASYWDEAIWDESFWSSEADIYNFRGSVYAHPGSFLSVGIWGRTKEKMEFFSTGSILKVGRGHI
jgi:hypothetical protein